jgi:two-component system NtrC family sensor kinase
VTRRAGAWAGNAERGGLARLAAVSYRTPLLVYRSLRFQLIAIVIATVGSVLVGSQWLDTSLSERAMERDLRERAQLALGTVDSLWGRSEPGVFMDTLRALVEADREISAIDIFRLSGDAPTLEATTRPAGTATSTPTADQARQLAQGIQVTTYAQGAELPYQLRVLVPLRREGAVIGAAEADLSLANVLALKKRLRAIDGAFVVFSIASISLALALFLERRVARPVTAMVDGMRRAEAGALHVRVEGESGGEFGFLARSFNRMVARIEELTSGLELRVRQATAELAERNRELQEANEKLWRAQLEVGRSERLAALGQMAATIAHELGTPLNSVLGYTQLLLRGDVPPDQAAKLHVIESQVQRMIEIIRSVLDRTRDRDLRRGPVEVGPIIDDALALVSSRLAGRQVVVRREIPPDLPPVPGDALALRQVLLNLLTNAVDATEPPGIMVVSAVVLTEAQGLAGRYLELAVRDSGHGMTAEEQRRVFEPFYTTKAPGRGTGLGLVIVDHIVRGHGGSVVVDSVPGHGTTMRVRLPLET